MVSPKKSRRARGRPPSSHAEHRKIAAKLRTQINAGDWAPFDNLPTVRALAEAHGASICAVRLALEQLESEQLIARTARRRRLFLRPRPFSMDGRGIVLEVLSDPLKAVAFDPTLAEIQRGIMSGCSDSGAPLLIAHAHELQHAQPHGFLDLPLKGILLVGRFAAKNLRAYERLTVPVCNVDTPSDGQRLHSVSVDNVNAAYDATRVLIEEGHRRIAFIQFILYTLRDIDPDSKERKQGFQKACREARVSGAGNTVFSFLPGTSGQNSLRALLKVRPRFSAVLCVDPSSAAALTEEATNAGWTLPRDLKIVCFQGLTESTLYSGPASDFAALGRQAVRLLDHPKSPPIHERVRPVWRERAAHRP